MAGHHTSSKFSDTSPRSLESSRLLAPTKASLAKAKAASKVLPLDADLQHVSSPRKSDRLSSPTRNAKGNHTESHADGSYSSDDESRSLKRNGQFMERRKGSVSPTGSSEGKNHATQAAMKKYSDSVRIANAKGKSSPGSKAELKGADKSPRSQHTQGENLHVNTKDLSKQSEVPEPAVTGTRVPIWPDLHSSLTEKHLEHGKSWTSRVAAHDGYNSPNSTLEFRTSEDSLSPASTVSLLRPCNLEQSDSDADSDRKFCPPGLKEEEPLDPLEFASLDFIGDVEGMEQDLEYVRQILVSTGFAGRSLPEWFSRHSPINPSVFEKLEAKMALTEEASPSASVSEEARQSEARRQRMLLFDAVNEALGRRLTPHIEQPVWVNPTKNIIKPRPAGKALLKEVWTEIHEWPVPTSEEVYDILDDAARRDMVRGLEKWNEFGAEESEVVFELETLITQKLIEEAITCFAAIEYKHLKRRLSGSSATTEGAAMTRVK